MIRLQDLTPKIYYKQSRDFQFIGRLYDIIFNYIKSNTELINLVPLTNNLDNKLLDLVLTTLGFESLHHYSIVQIKALCSAFMLCIRNKGNIQSLELACNTIAHAEGLTDRVSIEIDPDSPYLITIILPLNLTDTTLLKDFLSYILPAGISARLIKASQVASTVPTIMKNTDKAKPTTKLKVWENNNLLNTLTNVNKNQENYNNKDSYNTEGAGFIGILNANTIINKFEEPAAQTPEEDNN